MNTDKKKYLFRHAAFHTASRGTAEGWQHFFRAVESQGHLEHQAAHFGSFERTSDDLETYCLPAIIQLEDWDRFVHYSLIAANLRGLASDLARADVLKAVTQRGRLDLAESLVDRLSDPVQRAAARAAIAGALDDDPHTFAKLADRLVQDLNSAAAKAFAGAASDHRGGRRSGSVELSAFLTEQNFMNTDKRKYLFRHAAFHTASRGTAEGWQHFFRAVESQGHLEHQAAHFGSFERTSDDLETYCLPAIIQLEDWDRFVHYSLIAANLRGLAEALARAEVLKALTQHGRLDLAESLVDRLSDPVQRAAARAAIAGALSDDPHTFAKLADRLVQDLNSASVPADHETAEAWCRTLEQVAQLGPDLRTDWLVWIGHLDAWPDLARQVWEAVAKGLLDSRDLEHPELWHAVAASVDANEPNRLLESLSRRLAEIGPDERWRCLQNIRQLEPMGELIAWSTCGATAGRLRATEATELWRRAENAWEPIPWTVEWVEAGRNLWPKLTPESFDRLVDGAGSRTIQAALYLTRFEQLSHENPRARLMEHSATVLAEIDRIPFPPQKLHQCLRYLTTWQENPGLQRQVVAVGEYLARHRYFMPPGDLCRFLDLIAELFPRRLRLEVQNVLWAPRSRAETLETLAFEARTQKLLQELLERIETYASTVAATEAQGFELRLDVLSTVTRRLCAMRGDLSAIHQAGERLLPEEEDSLRAAVAKEMAAIGHADLAAEACSPIRQGPLRRRTRLAVAPEAELEELLAPGALYQAVSDVEVIEDELRALSTLLEIPTEPDDLAQRHLTPIRSKGREIQARVDLAWHALAFQRKTLKRGRQDRPAALAPLKGALGVVESDEWLVALTPELAALGARLGTRQALAELSEASERIVALESIPWPLREQALEALLARLGCFFSEDPGELSGAGCRAAAAFVTRLIDLPRTLENSSGAEDLRQNWHRILPRIVAALERLPNRVEGYLKHPWRTRLGLDPPPPESSSPAANLILERRRDRWGDLQPTQTRILKLCFASEDERSRNIRDVESTASPDPDVVEALIYLLSARAPDRVPTLLESLPPGAERDRLILRWLHNGWAPGSDELFDLLSPERKGIGKAWHLLHDGLIDEGEWVAEICNMVSRDDLDPSDPRNAELRRRLWRLDRQHLPALASATLGALAFGGKAGAERGLRLFLNALLTPRFGHQGSDRERQQGERVATAAQKARSLAGDSGPESGVTTPLPPIQRVSKGLRRWPRAWAHRSGRLLARGLRWNDASSLAFLVALALFPSLMSLDAAVLTTEPITPRGLPPTAAVGAVGALACVWLINSWALGTALSLQTPYEVGLRPAVRGLRTLVLGIPLIGLFVLPIWRRLVESRPRWLFSGGGLSRRLELVGVATVSRGRPPELKRLTHGVQWTGRSFGFVGLYLLNFVVVSMAVYELAERASVDSHWRMPAAVVCGFLHGVAGAAVAYFASHTIRAEKISDGRTAVFASMPLFWLVPVPGLPLLGLMLLVVIPTPPTSLSTTAFSSIGGVGRFPRWSRFLNQYADRRRALPWWRRPLQPGESEPTAGESLREQLSLVAYRAKAALLFFEAAGVAWALLWLEELAILKSSEEILGLLAILSLCLGAFGVLALAVRFIRRVARADKHLAFLDHDLHPDFIAGTQLAFFFGLFFGQSLYKQNPDVFGIMTVVGLGGAIVHITPTLLSILLPIPDEPSASERSRTLWTLLYVWIGILGLNGSRSPETFSPEMLDPFVHLMWLGLMCGPLVGAGTLPWLLQPFRPRLAFSWRTDRRLRRPLAFVAWTAILPLGGLAVPIWIYLREHRWPTFRGE